MRLRRVLAASLSTGLIFGATLLTAPAASADQIWYQGVGRATADAPCPTSSDADLKAGWSEWSASWAQWANGGRGGYVCTRAITWAYESTEGGGVCVLANKTLNDGSPIWARLGPGQWSIPMGTLIYPFVNAGCTELWSDEPLEVPVNVVYAPDGEEQAQARCEQAFGDDTYAFHPDETGPSIWICLPEDE